MLKCQIYIINKKQNIMNLKSIFSFSRALLLISSLLHVEFANSTSYEYFTESSGAYVVNQVCYKISGGNAYVTYSGLSKYYWYYDGHKYGPDFDGYVGGYLGTSADVTIPSSVTISSSTYNVTSIGEYAFEEENFTSVNLPDGIMTIGKEAFNYCENLTSINFPSSLKTIGSDAFAYCNKLTSAVIPSGVTNIDSRAFYGCSSLILLSLPNSITSIEESVFAGCSSLPSVTIPNSVMSIGNSAFSGCSSLASLIIPSSVTTIGSYSFYGCSSLASLTIPPSVTSISSYAFYGCDNLTSVYMNCFVPLSIGSTTFSNRSNATLYVPMGTKEAYEAADYWKDFKEIVEMALPSQIIEFADANVKALCVANWDTNGDGELSEAEAGVVTSLGDVFKSTNYNIKSFDELRYFKGLTSIDLNADFEGCEYYLTSLTIPSNVTSISYSGEYGNHSGGPTHLESIKVDPENTVYDSRQNCNAIIETRKNTLVFGCSKTTIPNDVKIIGNYAFNGCRDLTSISIPEGVESIGYCTFESSGLTQVSLPNSVSHIDTYAFRYTPWEESQPEGVIYVGKVAYMYKGTMPQNTSITIKDGTIGIAGGAFDGDFTGSKNLTTVVIPNTVTTIGRYAFNGTKLSSVVFPESVYRMGLSVFGNTPWLETQPNSIIYIGKVAYGYKGKITDPNISIKDGTRCIAGDAFCYLDDLVSVSIPSSVEYIGEQAFWNCNNLVSITIDKQEPLEILSAATFTNCKNATLYVPYGCKAAYEAAEYWKDFKEIVESLPKQTDKETLSVEDLKARSGSTVEMAINLTNESEDLTAYQFDLILPDGISLSVNDKGKYVVSKTSRYEDDSQTLNVSKLEGSENAYRFVCFSMSNGVITGKSGAILNAALTVGESVNEGSYGATITNIVFTKTDGIQLKQHDAKFNIVVMNVIPGDANGDGVVNVTDIVEIVNYIMEKPSVKFVVAAADLNGDGGINVTDIVKVVSIIMQANTNASRRVSAMEMIDNDQLTMAVDNDGVYSLHLSNEAQYVASQFEIRLGDGQTLEGVRLNGKRSDGHLMSYTQTGNNLYKVIVFSTENRPFSGNSGEFVSFKVSGNGSVEVSNILFVTSGEAEKTFPSLHAGTTGIDVTKISDTIDVYSIDGRMVRRQVTSTNDLEKGLYIIKGKKVIVK